MRGPIIVTTSWDDGGRDDLRVGELLQSHGMSGTFYVPIIPYKDRPALTPSDLRNLSAAGFEIGSHGFSHRTLPNLAVPEIAREVGTSKEILQDSLGVQVRMFCYPRGRYNQRVVQCLRAAGYVGARTTRMLSTSLSFRAFEMPTSLQCFPHNNSTYIRNLARGRNVGRALQYVTRFSRAGGWVDLGRRLFDWVMENGGIWHLYGHSWEIDELSLWAGLTELLDYVAGQQEVIYTSNGSLFDLTHGESVQAVRVRQPS